MRIVGVVDLRGGRAVLARGGRRDRYEPVRAVAGTSIDPGDAVALARWYVERLRLRELYVADLDAIDTTHDGTVRDRSSTGTGRVISAIAALGVPVWLDAGVSSPEAARDALALGASQVVVGLETLTSYVALESICDAVGGTRVAFSLDLRDGEPIVASDEIVREPAPLIALRAVTAGAGAIIVIDLARVGTSGGLDVELLARVRAAAPAVTLLAGGGVRGPDDLARLDACGCDGALVATALHEGMIAARSG